ncbi:MAG: DUF378 domain-containing protein [Candidatus Omnitrophica bacterium]|nr:DUF378 domain-containing protein [Candidatus Omnitrophota bacterium]
MKKCLFCKVAALVTSIGAMNWGLVTIFNFNLVTRIFGDMTTGARIIYGLIAGMGVIVFVGVFRKCPLCQK